MTPGAAVLAAFVPLMIAAVLLITIHRYIAKYKKYAREMVQEGQLIHDVDKVMAVLVLCRKHDVECWYLWARLKEIHEGLIIKKVKEAKASSWR